MLATRTIIGLVVGSLVIGLGAFSLVNSLAPTISMNENFVIGSGDSASFSIPAPKDASQYMMIVGDAFDVKLTSPGEGLNISNTSYKKELILDWAHTEDGQTIILIQNTGASELEIATVGRDKMEMEIANTYPEAEYMDTWVWFQSGINTDGAHNPKTFRKLKSRDILSLNTFPMISGYYTALERTLFLNEISDASLKAWEANITVHKKGLELIKPGAKCSEICKELNDLFAQLGYLQYRTFGYGHSFGVLSHFYGRESGLELREDIHTVLEPNMVISMEPMIMIPEGKPGAGGYREHDILVIKENGTENITKFPFGPEHNIVKN